MGLELPSPPKIKLLQAARLMVVVVIMLIFHFLLALVSQDLLKALQLCRRLVQVAWHTSSFLTSNLSFLTLNSSFLTSNSSFLTSTSSFLTSNQILSIVRFRHDPKIIAWRAGL
eukprot:GHVP01032308.1.p1 GENE.GHVP01032308.1~~GHVP01032308.1.p1  ORF type:complete len:114 (-),score=5.76 GHVP01032308.1:453-794(-)